MNIQDELAKLHEFYGTEELHPDLLPYLEKVDDMPMLRHPLVYFVPFSDMQSKHANRLYEHRKADVAAALRNGEPHRFVFAHERPYRLAAFQEYLETSVEDVTDSEYWRVLSSIWIDTENYWQNKKDWIDMFQAHRHDRLHFMDMEERMHLAMMDSEFTVYRGATYLDAQRGLSWSLSEERAKWFAKRLHQPGGPPPVVVEGAVRRGDVIGLLESRGEEEIVALPWNVVINKIGELE